MKKLFHDSWGGLSMDTMIPSHDSSWNSLVLLKTLLLIIICGRCHFQMVSRTSLSESFWFHWGNMKAVTMWGFQVARETNDELRAIKAEPSEGFDIGAVLVIARRYFLRLCLDYGNISISSQMFSWPRPSSTGRLYFHNRCFWWSNSFPSFLICSIYFFIRELGNEWEATRLEALRWISVLLERHRTEVSFL